MNPPHPSSLESARAVLAETFGHADFRAGQEDIIAATLAGRDVLAIMPTGGGKSLCYQLPALLSDGVTLVISPLIALMKDQVDALSATGISAAAVNSSLSFEEVRAVMGQVRSGEIKLLYVAPERFGSRWFMGEMAGISIARVAVDEAHCISQWGHDFRPAYLRIREALDRLGSPPVSALTATATPQVQDDICAQLALNDPARFVTGFERPNLTFEVSDEGRKQDRMIAFMRKERGPGIVYCATRKHVEEAAERLRLEGIDAVAYHAGLDDAARSAAQDGFINGRSNVIVATNAFGMGVDKANVRFVLHYDMPGTLEAYYQEAGRAGRDGAPARCTVLYGRGDRFTQEFFINGSHPTEGFVRRVWEVLTERADGDVVEISGRELLAATGEEGSDFAVSSALKLLELAGGLTRLNPRENKATIRLLDRGKIGARAQVQQRILDALAFYLPPGENGAVDISPGEMAHAAGLEHEALLRGLHAMEEAGAIQYVPPFRGRGVRLLAPDLPRVDFRAEHEKRAFALASLDEMEDYCRTTECRRVAILRHFGEEYPEGQNRPNGCNACDRCLGGPSEKEVEATVLAQKLLSGVARCHAKSGFPYGAATVAAHLTGGNTESVRKNGLDTVRTYGLLKQYTQKQVADLLEQLVKKRYLKREDAGDGAMRRPVLILTEKGGRVLKSEEAGVTLRVPRGAPERPAKTSRPARTTAAISKGEYGPLFDTLCALRSKLAKEEDVPAYRVFTNRALEEMATYKPKDTDSLAEINGVGPAKLDKYGVHFLAAIRQHEGT